MSNPVISAAPENSAGLVNFSTEGTAYLEGAGVFQDAASTLTDACNGDWGALGMDLAADALDFMSFVIDPFKMLLGAPVGWIIEHIGFLKEALDLVAGDPAAVRSKAQTWNNIAAALDKSAADYRNSAKTLGANFTGTAATAYQTAAHNYSSTVAAAGTHARDAAKAFEVAGVIVGTVRGIIRDAISDFVAKILERGLVALAASPETFGGSIAAWVVDTVAEGAILAERNAAKILRAVRQVNELAHGSQRVSTALRTAERDLAEGASRRAAAVTRQHNAARDLHTAEQRAEAARHGVSQAEAAQARARTHLAEADTPAKRADAENELRNAQTRAAHHQHNLDEAQGQQAAARREQVKGKQDYVDGTKHEHVEPIEKNLSRVKDRTKEAIDSKNNSDEDSAAADENSGDLDTGSLV